VKQRIVLLGPPASGKGTQADRLSLAFDIPHVSTGALLRSECANGTPLGREADSFTSLGLLVPDLLAVRLVTAWMGEHGTALLLDGFPRTVSQAESLDVVLAGLHDPLDLVAVLELSDVEIRRRILDRLTCNACGATFGSGLHGLAAGDCCPRCGFQLARRNDDTLETLDRRLHVYREKTVPVIDYYQRTAPRILRKINAELGSDEVFEALRKLMNE
jgi:adenylate kinase